MEKWKLRSVETIPGMWAGDIKGNDEDEWIQLWYTVKTVNVTVYPSTTIINKGKIRHVRLYQI
jgi:hypothetical protein